MTTMEKLRRLAKRAGDGVAMPRVGFVLLGIIAVSGWLAVIGFSLEPYPWFRPWTMTWELAACFCLGALARTLAFRVFRAVRIALDSAFYVAVTFIWGAVPAAWLILLIITADAAVRVLRGHAGVSGGRRRLWFSLLELAQTGALPALVLLLLSAAFGIDESQPYTDRALIVWLPIFSLAFLVVHYFLAGGAHWFQGARSAKLFRGFFFRVVIAELTLVPLSLAMVLDYLHHGMFFFLLLGCTALLFNWIFRRAVITSEKLDERASELATINNVGRILSSSLERRTLIMNIASETVRLVGSASRFVLGAYDSRHENIVVDVFLRGEALAVERRAQRGRARVEPVQRGIVPRGHGLTGWVMQNRRPLLLSNVPEIGASYVTDAAELPPCASWLGVPLTIYDEVFGVMAVESDAPNAYTGDHLRTLMIIADHAAVALENARLYELATVDGLTGLYVRRYFDQRLNEEWRRGTRYGQEFSIGILDLDHFKRLNDTYGHQAGDQVLRGAATVLRDNMRGADIAGRYGGEEFAFILPRTTIAEAKHMADRIRGDIEAMRVVVNGERLHVTCSIGVAGYPECGAPDSTSLLAFADQALYDAKSQGRNRVLAAPHTEIMPPRGVTTEERLRSEAVTQEILKPVQ